MISTRIEVVARAAVSGQRRGKREPFATAKAPNATTTPRTPSAVTAQPSGPIMAITTAATEIIIAATANCFTGKTNGPWRCCEWVERDSARRDESTNRSFFPHNSCHAIEGDRGGGAGQYSGC